MSSSNVAVAGGLFTTRLDFGASPFNGQARWLETAVRCPAGSEDLTTLSPRQALAAAPYALHATVAGFSGNSVMPGVMGANVGGGGSHEAVDARVVGGWCSNNIYFASCSC